MEIKGFLFFCGSLLRWPALNTKYFMLFHAYILAVYAITYSAKSISVNASVFLFTVSVLSPLMIAIGKGLPLDCLNYKSAIERENSELNVEV